MINIYNKKINNKIKKSARKSSEKPLRARDRSSIISSDMTQLMPNKPSQSRRKNKTT